MTVGPTVEYLGERGTFCLSAAGQYIRLETQTNLKVGVLRMNFRTGRKLSLGFNIKILRQNFVSVWAHEFGDMQTILDDVSHLHKHLLLICIGVWLSI